MTEPTDWGQKKLARVVGEQLGRQQARVNRRLLEPVILTDEYWTGETSYMRPPIARELEIIAGHSAEEHIELPVFAELDLEDVSEDISEWVESYSFDLITGINDRTRSRVAQAIEEFHTTEGMTRGELEEMLVPSFGPNRASMIAVTETTTAYYEGGKATIERAEALGIEVVHLWNTNNDSLVCEICGPLNRTAQYGYPKGEYEYGWEYGPPAHPRCRCWVTYELA